MILGRSLSRTARIYGDKPAVVELGGRTLTHRQFAERVYCLANALISEGLIRKNVAILGRNSAAYLEVYFACGLIGSCLVPINYHLGPREICARLLHSNARVLVVDEEFIPLLEQLPSEAEAVVPGGVYVIGRRPGPYTLLDDLSSNATPCPVDVQVDPETPLYIGYTSGTTGPPKGALISHRAIVGGFLYKALECSLSSSDVNCDPGPFWHSAPRDFASLAIYLGGTTIVTKTFEAGDFLRIVDHYRVTNSFLVPTMLQMIADETDESIQVDVSSLRLLITAGAPLNTATKNKILDRFGPVLFESYGATETRMITSIRADELRTFDRSVGRAAADVDIRVLDESGLEVEPGEVGEIYVRGPGLFSGYHRDAERNRASHRGEWFSLGDMGRIDSDGYLFLLDRKQDMIISGGENIFPNDVEEILLGHPGVNEAAVIGTPHQLWGEQVTAIVVLQTGHDVSAPELIKYCSVRLPAYMKPRRIEFAHELPRNATGKVLRSVLRTRYSVEGQTEIG